ncbi:glycolate oxidase iron-sulfur subunit [Marinobacter lipolyticus SM19]|uniref:Glycolate oxidase iron-sulfur subunit n=1 Tax=Marinobacter lipolyticus SM19 TaxID=1318628 RepID=R8B3P2_9GAMM|nr:DUF4124 domain-containing protein [Marinobacter lipolyticus]EON93191.1 glycolate oxidase iron-sulfur subunit [Marinobacter lipolyticus SM19]
MPGSLAAFLIVSLFASSVSAGVYTWTDADGVVHFSDRQPLSRNHDIVTLTEPSVVPMSENIEQGRRVSTINQQVSRSLERSSSDGRSSGTGKKADARHQKTCDGYRKRLARIQQQLRAGYSNDRGNRLRRQRREVSQALSRECLLR